MTDDFTYHLKVTIQNMRGVQKDFLQTVASKEEMTLDQLRKIVANLIDDVYPDWCLHTLEVSTA